MSYNEAIPPPLINPLRHTCKRGQPPNEINTDTFIELTPQSHNTAIFFTTDGSTPDPWRRKSPYDSAETFPYKGPFTLKPGVRALSACAVHRDTGVTSYPVTTTFLVKDNRPEHKKKENPRHSEPVKPKKKDKVPEKKRDSSSSRSSSPKAKPKTKPAPQPPLPVINVYSQPPPPVPPPVQPAIPPPQLHDLARALEERIDRSRAQVVDDMKKVLQDHAEKQVRPPKAEPASPPKVPPPVVAPDYSRPPVKYVSDGGGDLNNQLLHIYGHLLQFARTDPHFASKLAQPQLGTIQSASFDDHGGKCFTLTMNLVKPNYTEPPKPTPPVAPPAPTVHPVVPPPAPPVVFKQPEVEKVVEQPPEIKAKPIELKTEEKPKEKVESPYFETEEYKQEGTLKPWPNFNADEDAQALRKAMKGLGTDEKAITEIMGRRSLTQRLAIVQHYKSLFGKDLVKGFESELSGNYLRVVKALCLGAEEYDASELKKAMQGLGTDEDCLIEIICTRTNAQLKALKETYKTKYNRDLEADVESDTSSHFKHLLISLLQATRPEGATFDRNAAVKDAQDLYNAGEKKWGTDESKFNEILLNRSNAHLRAMFGEYQKLAQKGIAESIQSEVSGDFKKGLLTVVRCIQNKPLHFAEMLYKSMKGLGTDDRALLRIVITRAEVDLVNVKDAFVAQYGKTLGEWIKGDTSGDYRHILLLLIGEGHLLAK